MGMRMSHNAMCGSESRAPESIVLQALAAANPKSSLCVEFLFLCDNLNIPREKFEGWGDDELRGLTLELAQGMDIPMLQACQLVAKVNGLVQRSGPNSNVTAP